MSQLLQFYRNFQQSRQPVVKAQPTFEDLTIDDHLTEHQRVVRYVKSTIGLQRLHTLVVFDCLNCCVRLVHVKMLSDVARTVGFNETVATIIPLLGPLSKDVAPVVKQHLVEQLKTLAEFCLSNGGEAGYKIILDTLLPITAELLEDEKPEVRQSASLTLVEIAKLIRNDDIGQYVLTIILKLSHEDDKEEMRMTASSLLNLLAESMGQDLCKQFIIPEVVSLAEDPVFRVRKSTALNFHNICKVGGEHELLERLMPAFVRLSKDDIYRVRRACAESLSEISKNVGEDIRLGVLVEIFLRLTQDPSKLVKQSILQQSGMFIATLPARAVTETILSHYSSMAYGPTGDLSVDAELKHICAYSFPAVLQIIGKNRWKDVRALYHNLAQSRSLNIKQTLSYSLHEIARILDDEKLVEEELVPVFEEMIQDQEAVQMGVIKHLASFLRFLPEPCRVSFLPPLHDILHSTNPFNWRLRQNLAVQLPELCDLPPKNELFRTMFPLVMILLQDPVSCVRRDSFKGVTSLINALHSAVLQSEQGETLYQQQLDEVARAINSLVEGEKYQLRQLWVELCHQLLRDVPRDLFERYFVRGILLLTSDKVCNIRVALSYFLVDWDPSCAPPWEEGAANPSPWHWLLRRPDIAQCIERLSQDDNDIYLNLMKLQKLYPNVTFAPLKCRGRRTPPGGSEPVAMNPMPLEYEDVQPSEEICRLRTASEDGHFAPASIGDAHAADKHRHSIHEDDGHILRPIGVDMSSVDINVLLPRVRASSFPKLDEEFPGEGSGGTGSTGFDDELDIIDGLGAFPKHLASPHSSGVHEGVAPVIHRSSEDEDEGVDPLVDNVKPADEGDVSASAAAAAAAAIRANAGSDVEEVELIDATSPNAFSSPIDEGEDSPRS